jgi:hypothetical protein
MVANEWHLLSEPRLTYIPFGLYIIRLIFQSSVWEALDDELGQRY